MGHKLGQVKETMELMLIHGLFVTLCSESDDAMCLLPLDPCAESGNVCFIIGFFFLFLVRF